MRATFLVASVASLTPSILASPVSVTTIQPTTGTIAPLTMPLGSSAPGGNTPGTTTAWTSYSPLTRSASEALHTSYVIHLSDTTFTTIAPASTHLLATTNSMMPSDSHSASFSQATVPPAYSQGATNTGTYSTSLPTVGAAQQLGNNQINGAGGIRAGAVFAAVLVAASTFASL